MSGRTANPERHTIRDIVVMCVKKFERPASEFWAMTLADLLTSLAEPDDPKTATTAAEQRAMCVALDERFARLDTLTPAQRIELERWKTDLM